MIKEAGINFTTVPERAYDNPWRIYRCSHLGRTGGVAEAALRYMSG